MRFNEKIRENSRCIFFTDLWLHEISKHLTNNIQCFKSSRANLCKAILLYYTQILEQACSELAEPNCIQKLSNTQHSM